MSGIERTCALSEARGRGSSSGALVAAASHDDGPSGGLPQARDYPRTSAVETLVDQLAAGIFLLDAQFGLMWANTVATALLMQSESLGLSRGRLRFVGAPEQARFARRLALAVRTGRDSAMLAPRPSGQSPLLIRIFALGLTLSAPEASIGVIVIEPRGRLAVSVELLRELFDLTPGEAAAAVAVAETRTIADAAAKLGVARNTVKSLLHRAFAKTGVRTQAGLVRVLEAAAAGFAR